MFCKNCGCVIDDNARFCSKCGTDQTVMMNNINPNPTPAPAPTYSESVPAPAQTYMEQESAPAYGSPLSNISDDLSSTLLLAFVAIFVLASFFVELIAEFSTGDDLRVVYGLLLIVRWLSFFLVPLCIKKMPFKIVAFVLLCPLMIYYFYHIIKYIF